MYEDSDIEAAVEAGILTPQAAAAFRAHVAGLRAAPRVDEESFRLLTGFNDIFVSIAATLMLVAVGGLGAYAGTIGAAVAVAGASWALAEFFTARRRMALPSILLMFGFVGGASWIGWAITASPVVAMLAAAGAAYAHWWRFKVPITMAALGIALVGLVVALFGYWMPSGSDPSPRILIAGIALFGFAMWWDTSDRTRVTRRSDVAFWLHLAAAPMIAHSLFHLIGVTTTALSAAQIGSVLLLYLLFGVIALAIDRRALLVSSLAYVLYALSSLFQAGAVGGGLTLTALVIGSALLLLSAFWHPIRRALVMRLPQGLRFYLPVLDRPDPARAPAR